MEILRALDKFVPRRALDTWRQIKRGECRVRVRVHIKHRGEAPSAASQDETVIPQMVIAVTYKSRENDAAPQLSEVFVRTRPLAHKKFGHVQIAVPLLSVRRT